MVKISINTNKNKLINNLKLIEYQFNKIVKLIDKLDNYYNLIKIFFTQYKIILIYQLDKFKNQFKILKKMITQNKILYNKTIQLYSNIIVYFAAPISENINTIIIKLYDQYNLIQYNITNIVNINKKDILNFLRFKSNKNYIIINNYDYSILNLINKLYLIHIDILQIKNNLYHLKKNKLILFLNNNSK